MAIAPTLTLLLGCTLAPLDKGKALGAAYNAVYSQRYEDSLAGFELVLSLSDPADFELFIAKLGQSQALVHLDHTQVRHILSTIADNPRIDALDYRFIASELTSAAQGLTRVKGLAEGKLRIELARTLLEDGACTFPNDKHWPKLLTTVEEASKRLGQPDLPRYSCDYGADEF